MITCRKDPIKLKCVGNDLFHNSTKLILLISYILLSDQDFDCKIFSDVDNGNKWMKNEK